MNFKPGDLVRHKNDPRHAFDGLGLVLKSNNPGPFGQMCHVRWSLREPGSFYDHVYSDYLLLVSREQAS